MGYRSDVRIITSKDGFEELSKFVEEYLKDKDDYNLLKNLEVDVKNKQCYIGWNFVKWYDGYDDVDAIMKGLEHLGENEYSYRFMRIGESYDDIEEMYCDGRNEDINLEYPSMIREFDDNYMTEIIEKDKEENIEENMDEIDYE